MVVNGIFEKGDLSQKSYSTVTIDEVEFDDDEGILGPVPPSPLGGPHPGVDPQGLVDPKSPLNGDDAYVLAIHAINPEVNKGGPKGPGGKEAPNKKVALNTIIGLRAFAPGPEYTNVEVPIFRTPQIIAKFGLGEDKRLPPDGSSGGAEIAATLWYFVQNPNESGPPLVPKPIKIDGSPVQATTTITEDLDENSSLDSLVGSSDGGTAGFKQLPQQDGV